MDSSSAPAPAFCVLRKRRWGPRWLSAGRWSAGCCKILAGSGTSFTFSPLQSSTRMTAMRSVPLPLHVARRFHPFFSCTREPGRCRAGSGINLSRKTSRTSKRGEVDLTANGEALLDRHGPNGFHHRQRLPSHSILGPETRYRQQDYAVASSFCPGLNPEKRREPRNQRAMLRFGAAFARPWHVYTRSLTDLRNGDRLAYLVARFHTLSTRPLPSFVLKSGGRSLPGEEKQNFTVSPSNS